MPSYQKGVFPKKIFLLQFFDKERCLLVWLHGVTTLGCWLVALLHHTLIMFVGVNIGADKE